MAPPPPDIPTPRFFVNSSDEYNLSKLYAAQYPLKTDHIPISTVLYFLTRNLTRAMMLRLLLAGWDKLADIRSTGLYFITRTIRTTGKETTGETARRPNYVVTAILTTSSNANLMTLPSGQSIVDSDGGILSEPIETLDVAAKLLREIAEISDTLGVLKGISGVILRITTAIVTIEQNSEEWKELGNVLQAQEKLLKDQLTRLEWDDTEYHKTCPLRAPFQETLERLLEEIIERLELQGNHAVTVYQHLKTFIWRMASVEREKADIATISQRLTQNMENLQVITIDSAAERYALQPDNAIVLPKWKPGTKGRGEHGEGDLGLVGLIPFVESVVIYNTAGVRPIFKAYHGRDITAGCAKVEVGGWSIGRLSINTAPTPKELMTFFEQKRAFGQMTYQEDSERPEAEKETIKQQKKLMIEQAQKEMMAGGVFGALRRMGLGPPPEPYAPPSE
ncbi:mitochondrial inner membrane protein required for protein import [Serendipita sp. 405]|nr:mitochondrial inner membrane protein required for protein import [Serendipita sp. 405]